MPTRPSVLHTFTDQQRFDTPASLVDIVPTFLAATGADPGGFTFDLPGYID